jgi:broad specificity phosphatase PhoE
LETAQAVGRAQGLEVLIEPGLTEIDHGEWDGLHKSEVEERFADTLHLWLRRPTKASIPGGESLVQVQGRVQAALAKILLGHPNQTVMVCTHDAVLKVAIITALGLSLDSFWAIRVDNASISILEHDGHRGRLMLLNDTCHLGEMCSDSSDQAL